MTLERGKSGWVAWLGTACIALLLVATTAQAVHVCGSPLESFSGPAQFAASDNGLPGSAICLTCLMAQSAVAALFFIFSSPRRHRTFKARPAVVQPRSFLDFFHLYVRPPPAC